MQPWQHVVLSLASSGALRAAARSGGHLHCRHGASGVAREMVGEKFSECELLFARNADENICTKIKFLSVPIGPYSIFNWSLGCAV